MERVEEDFYSQAKEDARQTNAIKNLNENYLLGYEPQRNVFFTEKETVKTEE